MKQHTTRAGLLAVAAALIIGSPAPGQTREEVQELRREVTELRDEVNRLRSRFENERRDTATTNRAILSRLEEMNQELRRLNDSRAIRSTSAYGRDVLRATGSLRFRNSRLSAATVIVEGISYTVEPLGTRIVNQPAGPVNYEVFVDGYALPPRTTRLDGNETLTVNIY